MEWGYIFMYIVSSFFYTIFNKNTKLPTFSQHNHANYPQKNCIDIFGKFQVLNLYIVSQSRQKFFTSSGCNFPPQNLEHDTYNYRNYLQNITIIICIKFVFAWAGEM